MESNKHQLDVAVVLGSAPTADEELEQLPFTYDLITVNQAGIRYPGSIEAWVSLHANDLPGWVAQRAELGFEPAKKMYSNGSRQSCGEIVIRSTWPGSSGLFAVQVALMELHYDRVVLCGVHMSGKTRKDGDHVVRESPMDYSYYCDGWHRAYHHIKGRVASMGGWTRELLGPPDDDFWRIL